MHEFFSWFLQPSEPSQSGSTNNKDILVAIVGVVGTLIATGLTAFIASFRREKTSSSTVDSIQNQAAMRHEKAWSDQLQDMREDLDMANYEKDNYNKLYQRLREAVWAKGMSPDVLMEELG